MNRVDLEFRQSADDGLGVHGHETVGEGAYARREPLLSKGKRFCKARQDLLLIRKFEGQSQIFEKTTNLVARFLSFFNSPTEWPVLVEFH